MSRTTQYQKATMRLSATQLELTVEEAYGIIDDITEMFPIKELARVIIDEFRGMLEEDLSLQERIDEATKLAKQQRGHYNTVSWHFKCASRLAERSLILAGRIVKRRMTHSKAVEDINHIVEGRNRQREQRMAKHRLAPVDTAEFPRDLRDGWRSSKPSPKQQPRRRHSERRTRQPIAQRRNSRAA